MAASEDTEITLGTGKMLGLFFGLVALCAVFFGMGFSLGKNSARTGGDALASSSTPGGSRPTAVKANGSRPPSDLTFYKAVGQKDADAQLPAPSAAAPANDNPAPKSPPDSNAPPDLTAVSPQSAYYVQVAAVSKQEDAGALVDALKRKQYAAFAANTAGDKLFHVQVGPFSDIKDAELARAKLVSDGYNPILKK
jgi:DedD protein